MEELLKSIGNYGFPMAITAYLLLRFEGKIESLAQCIGELNETIKSFMGEYKYDPKK